MLPATVSGKKTLWLRLRQYQFEHLVPTQVADHVAALFGPHEASTRAFAGKLRRKLGWSRRFALRAIDEYRKFLFLGVVDDTPVTPSKVIDQVWHEHLLFTRAYREFCRDVLQHEFDHHPELVPMEAQTAAFSVQYKRTLERYVAEFNVLPPSDIWGTPKFTLAVTPRAQRPERRPSADGDDDAPLYLWFDGRDGGPSTMDLPEFGGGGGFGGGGAGDSWGDAGSDAGGDAGSGSGCSSSCGGGCGGD